MKKNGRKKIGFVLLFIFVFCLFLECYHLKKIYFISKKEAYETTWNISLPDDLKEIYHVQTPVVFLPDGEKYTVFEVQKEQMDLEGFYRGGIQKKFAEDMLELLEVPEEEKPDFSKNYVWREYRKHSDTLLVLYFFEENRVYFFQRLI